jgi:hypothetical protein
VLRIRDVYPGSRILIFTHPGSRIQKQQQKRGVKKNVVIPFYVATNFTKLQIILVLVLKKKIWANFQRIIELFTQKIITKLSKIWIWDPGSGKKPIPDPGSMGQKGTGSWIPDPDPQHCKNPRVLKVPVKRIFRQICACVSCAVRPLYLRKLLS